MITILYIFAKTVALLLSAISFAMLVRVILPLFVTEPESNKLYVFVFVLTELFLTPVRFILTKLGIGNDSPFDMSFIIGYLLLIVIQSALPAISGSADFFKSKKPPHSATEQDKKCVLTSKKSSFRLYIRS